MAKFSMKELLSIQSKGVESVDKTFEIEHIPIEYIVPSPNNEYGIRDIEELAANIEFVGLINPLVVRNIDSNKYELISGERRYTAIKMLYEEGKEEWKTIPCIVEKDKDNVFAELELLFANSMARELTSYERTYQASRTMELLKQLKKDGYKFKGRIREIVAEMLKVSSSQVARMESIDKKLSPELKEAFKEEEINITEAYELSKLPQEKQEKACEELEIKGQINIHEIKEIKEEVASKPIVTKESYVVEHNLVTEKREINVADTVKALETIVEELESGICSVSFNIASTCSDAITLLKKMQGGD